MTSSQQDMPSALQLYIDLTKVDHSKDKLNGANFSGANFTNANLTGIHFNKATMVNARFEKVTPTSSIFNKKVMPLFSII